MKMLTKCLRSKSIRQHKTFSIWVLVLSLPTRLGQCKQKLQPHIPFSARHGWGSHSKHPSSAVPTTVLVNFRPVSSPNSPNHSTGRRMVEMVSVQTHIKPTTTSSPSSGFLREELLLLIPRLRLRAMLICIHRAQSLKLTFSTEWLTIYQSTHRMQISSKSREWAKTRTISFGHSVKSMVWRISHIALWRMYRNAMEIQCPSSTL